MKENIVMSYTFDELTDEAKEKARDWWRGCIDLNDYDFTTDDAVTIGELLGIEFDTRPVKLYGGGTRQDPCIYWSGFYSQGDGACFEGYYRYNKNSVKKVKEYAPQDTEILRIAKTLQEVQRRNFYQLYASVKHTGRYCHSHSVSIDVERSDEQSVSRDDYETVEELLRDFMDWIYSRLEDENDWLNSDEQIDETIRANEYEFYESGEIF